MVKFAKNVLEILEPRENIIKAFPVNVIQLYRLVKRRKILVLARLKQ